MGKLGEIGDIVEIIAIVVLIGVILYVLKKFSEILKDVGGNMKEALSRLKDELKDMPQKFGSTGKDLLKTITEAGTPEGNEAQINAHYGGYEWAPGTMRASENGAIRRYGYIVNPGETKVFAGGTYTEVVQNNLVNTPYDSRPIPKEDAIARKYGFLTYAQFNAWLEGVKARLRAEGKDPSRMSLDELVKIGRQYDKQQEEWAKQNPDKATPVLDAQPTIPTYMEKYADIEAKRWEAIAKYYLDPKPKPSPGDKQILPIIDPRKRVMML